MRNGRAILSKVDKCATKRKSWKTTPIRRRNPGKRSRGKVMVSCPNIRIAPRLGRCARYNNFSNDVLPAPDAPVRKWKLPGYKVKLMSVSVSTPAPYLSPTLSNSTTLCINATNATNGVTGQRLFMRPAADESSPSTAFCDSRVASHRRLLFMRRDAARLSFLPHTLCCP